MKDFNFSISETTPSDVIGDLQPKASMSFYDGANHSIKRGQIFNSPIDTRRELDSYSRNELIRRVRWLRANVGFFKGFVQNAARLVGWLHPSMQTDDDDWNRLANDSINRYLMQKNQFDKSGKFNFKTAQKMIFERSLTDGDMLTVFSSSRGARAQFAFYEAHQLRSPLVEDGMRWSEGIRTDRHNKHVSYGVFDGDNVSVIPAVNCHYYGLFDSVNHQRSHPPLAHFVNHAMDITEVWGDTKHAIKSAALFGVVTEVDTDAQPRRAAGLTEDFKSSRTSVDSDGGVGSTQEVWGGGQMPKGNPGEKFKILNDQRPGPDQRAFTVDLKRDGAVGIGLHLEVLEDVSSLSGSGVRFCMASSKRWIEDKQLELADWGSRVVLYFLAKEVSAGRLPMPEDEEWLYKLKLTPRADLTIDRSQSSQRLDEIDAGAGTYEDWYATTGSSQGDWKQAFRQKFVEEAEIQRLEEEFKIDKEAVFKARRGANPLPQKVESKVEKNNE